MVWVRSHTNPQSDITVIIQHLLRYCAFVVVNCLWVNTMDIRTVPEFVRSRSFEVRQSSLLPFRHFRILCANWLGVRRSYFASRENACYTCRHVCYICDSLSIQSENYELTWEDATGSSQPARCIVSPEIQAGKTRLEWTKTESSFNLAKKRPAWTLGVVSGRACQDKTATIQSGSLNCFKIWRRFAPDWVVRESAPQGHEKNYELGTNGPWVRLR